MPLHAAVRGQSIPNSHGRIDHGAIRVISTLCTLVAVLALASACAAQPEAGPAQEPEPGMPVWPTIPADWSTTVSGAADLRLALPPWLVPFDTTGAVFASVPGGEGLELMAEGPRTAMPQPTTGEDLRQWLERRIGAPGQGPATVRRLDLPSGRALALERVDRPGTPTSRRLAAYAIQTPAGVAFLLIDGPPASWVDREDEADLIAWLFDAGAAQAP